MADYVVPFPVPVSVAPDRRRRNRRIAGRSLSDKLLEITLRSPKDLAALERLADLVLARLDRDEPGVMKG